METCGQTKLNCRTPSEKELEELPMHMRQKELCEKNPILYSLQITVDGKLQYNKKLSGQSLRSDIPVFINEQIDLDPGKHQVIVEVKRSAEGHEIESIIKKQTSLFRKGAVRLVNLID